MSHTAFKTYTAPAGYVYPFYNRLLAQKHLLIAGVSGAGKSVVVNGMIHTALARFPGHEPGCAQFIFLDAKGFELSLYKELPIPCSMPEPIRTQWPPCNMPLIS